MREKLIELKHLRINKAGEHSDLFFDTRFSESGYYAWKTEQDKLILIERDDGGVRTQIELEYDTIAAKFSNGQVEVYPPTHMQREFSDSFKIRREYKPETVVEIEKTKKFAVISKQRMREFDVYPYRSRLIECFDRVFDKGYEMIIFSQGLTVAEINLLSKTQGKTITHAHRDFRKWWGFSITKEFWDSMGTMNNSYNFFKNLEDRLAEKRLEAEYLESK